MILNTKILPFILFFFCTISYLFAQEPDQTKYSVEGTLTQTWQYCGGVAPTREQEEEYSRPKPYTTKLYIRQGKENSEEFPIYDSATTEGAGNFRFSLPPGDYIIILPSQCRKDILKSYMNNANQYLIVDSDCLKKWWKTGLFKFTVTNKNITNLDTSFNNMCFVPYPNPCFNYIGPYPP